MKNIPEKLKNIMYYGGVTRDEYKNIEPAIDRTNLILWRVISVIFCLLFITLFVVSFFVEVISEYRYLYLSMEVYFVLSAVIMTVLAVLKKRVLQKVMIYVNSTVVYVLGILLGTAMTPNELSVAFIVMLVIVPTVILDKPWRVMLQTAGVAVTYIIVVLNVKPEEMQNIEIFNTVVYTSLSVALNSYLIGYKFKSFSWEYRLKERVYVDALTGLGSELSYLKMVEELNQKITTGTCDGFAVVMMDLNNLKKTNDTYGHTFGCAMIVESAKYIHEHFKYSKTFHVGGDEFIAVLLGADYKNREKLIEKFDEKMKNFHMMKDGVDLRIVVARGMDIYRKEQGDNFHDVLRRADALMYKNKKYVKELYGMEER